jgi:hypothetical protein
VTKQTQADNIIHEDQLRNFFVNALTGAFGISIAGNGDVEPEDIYEVLVGATADGTSISTLCERSEDSYSGNDNLYHLRTKFELDTVRSVGNTLLREYTLEMWNHCVPCLGSNCWLLRARLSRQHDARSHVSHSSACYSIYSETRLCYSPRNDIGRLQF